MILPVFPASTRRWRSESTTHCILRTDRDDLDHAERLDAVAACVDTIVHCGLLLADRAGERNRHRDFCRGCRDRLARWVFCATVTTVFGVRGVSLSPGWADGCGG